MLHAHYYKQGKSSRGNHAGQFCVSTMNLTVAIKISLAAKMSLQKGLQEGGMLQPLFFLQNTSTGAIKKSSVSLNKQMVSTG